MKLHEMTGANVKVGNVLDEAIGGSVVGFADGTQVATDPATGEVLEILVEAHDHVAADEEAAPSQVEVSEYVKNVLGLPADASDDEVTEALRSRQVDDEPWDPAPVDEAEAESVGGEDQGNEGTGGTDDEDGDGSDETTAPDADA